MSEEEYEINEGGEGQIDVSLAQLIGLPVDISPQLIRRWEPILSKTLHLSNLTVKEIEDIHDNLNLLKIEKLRRCRRYELKYVYNREEFLKVQTYLTAALTLSRDGFAIKRLTTVHKHITYDDEGKKVKGGFFGFLRR